MQELTLTVKVSAPDNAAPAEVATILRRLIAAGLEDAQSTLELGEGDLASAELATTIHIGAPELA